MIVNYLVFLHTGKLQRQANFAQGNRGAKSALFGYNQSVSDCKPRGSDEQIGWVAF